MQETEINKKLDIFLCYRLEFRLCGSDGRVILFIRVDIYYLTNTCGGPWQ